jgi:actin-related protein 8
VWQFAKEYSNMAAEFKMYRRNNKRRVLPNSRELVVNWNSRNPPETISEHNDPQRVDWTEINSPAPDFFTGHAAMRIPQHSKPRYRLYWPLKCGWLNEQDYESKATLLRDFFRIIEEAIKNELHLNRKRDWAQYSCVFVIPDLYEKVFVTSILGELFRDFGFQRVCFIQESLAATYGAGYSSSCIVDVGAQKTSICCVEEGMCVENSRINLKFGGEDVTETFTKMMLFDHFNYANMDLLKRHDYLLAEELKQKFCTLEDAHISVQLYEFHLRAFGQDTRKYQFKTYDEVMLAPMVCIRVRQISVGHANMLQGFFRPAIFDHSDKLSGRRKLIERSTDTYDDKPNDPISLAQLQVYKYASMNGSSAVADSASPAVPVAGGIPSTPSKPLNLDRLAHLAEVADSTPRSSPAGSPAPDDMATPAPGAGDATPAIAGAVIEGAQPETEGVLAMMPLDQAIVACINEGAKGDEKKTRDFFGGIMVIGGGSKTYNFNVYLEQRLRALQPNFQKEILVGPPPRELDPQVLVWKGGSVFGKMRATNDSWIGQLEFDRLGARILNQKCMWAY